MSTHDQISWKNRLQEYCQRKKLRLPNYRIKEQSDSSRGIKFQVEVEVDGRWYVGDENFTLKKDAEHSAAQKACDDLCRNDEVSDLIGIDDARTQHMPEQYADIEEFLYNMVTAFGGRIRKIRPLNTHGRYKLDIGGEYRYCENIKKHHKKNQVYFLVDPVKRVYYQKCYDPDCQGFQSAKQRIPNIKDENNQHVATTTNETSGV